MEHAIPRRDFFKILGAGGASAAVLGCSPDAPERLLPYLITPEDSVPGTATWYATVCRECPAGCGLLARTREGRVIKVEGNPAHPVNQGKLCARGQAALQGLYNPDRLRHPMFRAEDGQFRPLSWENAEARLAARLAALQQEGRGERVVFITSHVPGSLDTFINTWLAALGSTRPLRYEAFAYDPLRVANGLTFGHETIPTYDLAKAQMLLAFGTDFLETWLSPVAYARDFAAMRAPRQGRIGTFVYVGPRLSLTAANADDWIAPKPGSEGFLALGMIHVMLAEGSAVPIPASEQQQLAALVQPYTPAHVAHLTEVSEGIIYRLARLFLRARPSLALGGGVGMTGSNATATCVAINLLNYVAGNIGTTVRFGPTAHLAPTGSYQQLVQMVDAMQAGRVEILLLYEANPLFTLPESAGLRQALQKVPLVVSFSSIADETTAMAHLVLPDHTPLESWGDVSPWQGVHGLMQPVMRPLWQTRAVGDVLLSLARQMPAPMDERFPHPTYYNYLRHAWQALHQRFAPDRGFDTFWQQARQRGGVWEEREAASITLGATARVGAFGRGVWEEREAAPITLNAKVLHLPLPTAHLEGDRDATLSLHLYPSLNHFDGRGANRPWLQELPDPMTHIVWDNWLEIHPTTARRLQLTTGDVVRVTSPYGAVELPVHMYEWIRPDVVAIPLGQGHTALGRYASTRGGNPMALLPPRGEPLSGSVVYLATKVQLLRTGQRYRLASTMGSDRQGARGIAQALPLTAVGTLPHQDTGHKAAQQIYTPHTHLEHRWGMTIDLNACIGCAACVVACYAENNIPIVGKAEVRRGREMSWLRLERYVEGPPERPDMRFLPMLCQQCDNAPCEPVCPVYATYHTPDGLNAQVYNRCVGVRYCLNNCPYKIRRFNWFTYPWPEPLHLQLNPDVSVREAGVMEKCTFCVQRIQEAQDRARDEGRRVRDGEIQPACVQTCPTQAIVFGDTLDPKSAVSALARDPRGYHVLEHLNTLPAVTYLKKISQDTERI